MSHSEQSRSDGQAQGEGPRPFVVISRSRVGSNLLKSYLNSSDEVHLAGEVAGRTEGRTPAEITDAVFHRSGSRLRAVGFKYFYYHPVDGDPSAFWAHLRGMDDLLVIHLIRLNAFRAIVSSAIAQKTGSYALIGDKTAPPTHERRVRIEPSALMASLDQYDEWRHRVEDSFPVDRRLEITYEGLVEDPRGLLETVGRFLGADVPLIETSLARQNPEALNLLVENLDELTPILAERGLPLE